MEAIRVKKLSIPVEEAVLQALDEVAGYYALSRPRLVQKLLAEGVQIARLDHAAGLYARREVTLEARCGTGGGIYLRNAGVCAGARRSGAATGWRHSD